MLPASHVQQQMLQQLQHLGLLLLLVLGMVPWLTA
jgi:hypothetical protein